MAEKKLPMRQCTGCREMKNKKELIRVLKQAESDKIIIDFTGKANGRGAYICNNIECFEKAVKCRGLERSLKAQIPAEVIEELRKEMGNGAK